MVNLLSSEYVPGVCNIGPAERRMRLHIGEAGLGVTMLFAAAALIFNFATPWRLLIFLPAFVSALGYLQYFMHFCAKFAFTGVINFSNKIGPTDSVEQAEFRRMDRAKALMILVDSAAIAGLAAGVLAILQ